MKDKILCAFKSNTDKIFKSSTGNYSLLLSVKDGFIDMYKDGRKYYVSAFENKFNIKKVEFYAIIKPIEEKAKKEQLDALDKLCNN